MAQRTRKTSIIKLTLLLICTSAVTTLLMPDTAIARDFKRNANNSAKAERSLNDRAQRKTTATNAQGESRSKTVDRSYDRENKTLNRDITGYNGKQKSTSTTYDKENKTFNTKGSNGGTKSTTFAEGKKTTTHTNKNGKSATNTTTYDKENKTVTKQSSNGSTRTSTYGDGQKTTSYTGANGKTGSSTTIYDKENKTATTQYQNGSSKVKTYEDGTRKTTFTNKDGKTVSSETIFSPKDEVTIPEPVEPPVEEFNETF